MKKNRIWTVTAIAFAFLLAICIGVAINGRKEQIGENPITGMNENRSHRLLAGETYDLPKEGQQKERTEEQKTKTAENQNGRTFLPRGTSQETGSGQSMSQKTGSGQSLSQGTGTGQSEPTQTEPVNPESPGETGDVEDDRDKTPTIITSLSDGQRIDGLRATFTVEGRDYKGYSIESFYFTVYTNDIRTYSSGENTYKRTYKPQLSEGENRIVIVMKDKEGNEARREFTVYADARSEPKVGGTVHIVLDARTIGLGYLLDVQQEFYEGDAISHVALEALSRNGFTCTHTGNSSYGWYLSRIGKPGITNGFAIPAALLEKLSEDGDSMMGHDADSLGEKDFYEYSGWIFMQNGESPSVGMASREAVDGDEIVIAFTLDMGKEYDGTWFDGTF